MQPSAVKLDARLAPLEPFKSLWRHRELFRRVLVRDIQSSFRGSVLGLAWVVLIPLVLVALYTFVFGVVLKATWAIPTKTPYEVPLVFFSSLTVFGFFMEVITRAPNYIRDNKVYVTKIVFPIDILCWVLVGTALFKLTVNFTLLLLFLALFGDGVPAQALVLPLLLVPFVLMAVGFAWLLASIGAFVRDLSHALQALAPVLMFVSPVFYALAQVPEAVRPIYLLNPLTFVIEQVRGILFFDQVVSVQAYIAYSLAAAAVYTVGFAFFQRLRPGFADVV